MFTLNSPFKILNRVDEQEKRDLILASDQGSLCEVSASLNVLPAPPQWLFRHQIGKALELLWATFKGHVCFTLKL